MSVVQLLAGESRIGRAQVYVAFPTNTKNAQVILSSLSG